MAQFDVYRTPDGQLLLDCQADSLGFLGSRLVVPLIPLDEAPPCRAHLNPVFEIEGERYAMVTQFAAALSRGALRTHVADLTPYRFDIIGAFDMMLTGV
jgi:toxin CcdB